MENSNPMSSSAPVPPIAPKKGLGTGAKIGIGCGVIVLLGIIAFIISAVFLGGKLKDFADEMQKNPTRATANVMVKTTAFEMVAEDDANKRYTLKEKSSGKLTTVYWDEKTQTPLTIEGDFSAIPAPAAADALPAPAPAPAPAAAPEEP
jgi:hypothetical protein